MFIGHFGVALAAKRFAPRASLGTLIFSAQFLDLLWPILLLLGVEHVRIAPGITRASPFDFYDYPISHSLLIAAVWSLLWSGLYFVVARYRRGAWAVGLGVLSHWVLDFVVHRPDLPLWPGGPRAGLGLWNSWPATIGAELLVFGGGLALYAGSTHSRDRVGRYAFWGLMAFLVVGWIASMAAGAPPDARSMAWGALSMWLLVPWGWWADEHREVNQRF
jgi:hypothetical protein